MHLHTYVLIQIYNRLISTTSITLIAHIFIIRILYKRLNGSFIYGFVVIVIIFLFMGHVLSCWGFCTPLICTGLRGVFLLVLHTLHVINNINIIVSECDPGWLPSETCWPSAWVLFFYLRRIPWISFLWGFAGHC